MFVAALLLLVSVSGAVAQQAAAPAAAHAGQLTVDRIYGQLSLSGQLTRGIAWSFDGKKFSFVEMAGTGKEAKPALYIMDASTGQRSLLVAADKLDSVLPAPSGKQSQATGLGRRAPSQVQWSVSGDALLFESATSLAWFDVKSQEGHVLVSGKEELADAKISPDGKYVAYATNETGDWEVYVSPFPQAESKWQVSRGGGEEPRWRGDGKELFYVSTDGKLMSANVKMGSSFEAMTPIPLFQTRRRQKISSQDVFTYSVSKDGNKFLFNTLMEQREAPPLSIVHSWNAELEK
jgi:Tol biopolymer transport system component